MTLPPHHWRLIEGGCRSKRCELSLVPLRQNELPRDGAGEAEKHVPLRIPDVALSREESGCLATAQRGRPPLEELVERAATEAAERDQKEESPCRTERRLPPQDLPADDRRSDPADEVDETVIVVSREPQRVAKPEPERNLRERVIGMPMKTGASSRTM